MRLMTRFFVNLVQKYLPDPFLFAVILTFIVYIGGILLTDSGPLDMIIHWGNGFWGLLTFAMQMVLVLVTGHALANSPIIKRFLQSIARAAGTPAKAIMITTFIAAVASWINWGFGLVVGALLGREMAKEIKGIDYRLLIASAYMGFLVWHGGLSGSIPLALATETDWSWAITGGIMVGETIFSVQTLSIAIVLILTLPILAWLMMPKKEETFVIDPEILKASEPKLEKYTAVTPAEKVE
ncbi:MAG TPA: TIGR00366 family protein, partial [Bacillota bacterium]|nr:TIGR00366 family protein [Bacillota bacterium]